MSIQLTWVHSTGAETSYASPTFLLFAFSRSRAWDDSYQSVGSTRWSLAGARRWKWRASGSRCSMIRAGFTPSSDVVLMRTERSDSAGSRKGRWSARCTAGSSSWKPGAARPCGGNRCTNFGVRSGWRMFGWRCERGWEGKGDKDRKIRNAKGQKSRGESTRSAKSLRFVALDGEVRPFALLFSRPFVLPPPLSPDSTQSQIFSRPRSASGSRFSMIRAIWSGCMRVLK